MKRKFLSLIPLLLILSGCGKDYTALEKALISNPFQALLIYEEGEETYSWYSDDWDKEYIHIIHSCTKSIVSILIGTLVDQGIIQSIYEPVYTYFPQVDPALVPEENRELTLYHFLTMTTGLDSRDSYLYRWEGISKLHSKDNWVQEILTLPRLHPPGEHFDYSNLASFLLGEVIRAKTGKDVSLYAEEVLFKPLGIDKYVWDRNVNGESTGWGGLHIRPDDLAKIGLLIMNRGQWKGKQIVSSSWIEESTEIKISPGTLREHYGYQWWIDRDERIMALGYAGQYLIIDRELELVTVFASELQERLFFLPYEIYTKMILPQYTD